MLFLHQGQVVYSDNHILVGVTTGRPSLGFKMLLLDNIKTLASA